MKLLSNYICICIYVLYIDIFGSKDADVYDLDAVDITIYSAVPSISFKILTKGTPYLACKGEI